MSIIELMEFVAYSLAIFSAGIAVGRYLSHKK